LIEASSHYRDTACTEIRTGYADQAVVLFSHHNKGTIANPSPDPANPAEPRLGAAELFAVLRRFPNVVAWINGHTHVNRVNAVPDPTGYTGGFWEITTAAHVDYPEHARLVELVDNRDGTWSFFATIIEHAAPATTDPLDFSLLGLAAISRELSANDPQVDPVSKLGVPTDLNVELVVRAPFAFNPSSAGAANPALVADASLADTGTLPRTGSDAGLPLLVGGALVGGALALRARREPRPR
jgi:LPXTG-motif cell wall-anchored protein